MTDGTFDPFDLPATFDPLAPVAPVPPRRRRLAEAAATAEAPPGQMAGAGAGGRLAHLLRPRAHGSAPAMDADARIAVLEGHLAALEARIDGLEARLIARLQTQGPGLTVDRAGLGKAI
jgi:hypothetical protein